MAYQSLYRRYRPQTFSAIVGQPHLVSALQGAVRDGKVGHAYLLHGPRGTGKTSTARVLAKALNCENLGSDGEPCTTCDSCVAIEQGRSFDLHELDAASNNGVEHMRELLARVNLGTPGRKKVYLLDEAHMLTPSASNALLKSLEEPPDHVTWVLATTEPHKLVETIRSRCQVFELGLLGAEELARHVRWIVDDAELDVDDEAIDHVMSAGGGSVRDTLSALDRVVAAGGTVAVDSATDTLLRAIADSDTAAALAAVGDATGRGRDPATIGRFALAGLRDAFLTAMGSPPPRLSESERVRAEELAATMSPAAMTRALETLGTAIVDMRQAPDPRVDLEVALVRLSRPDTDQSLEALVERVERLERSGPAAPVAAPRVDTASAEAGEASAPPAPPTPAAPPPVPEPPTAEETPPPSGVSAPTGSAGPAQARQAVQAAKKNAARGAAAAPAAPAPPPPVPVGSPTPVDLIDIRPQTATEVIQLAALHLGLDQDVVVTRAGEMLPPKEKGAPRDPAELAALWQSLVADHGPTPVAESEVGPPVTEAPPPVAEADLARPVVEPAPADPIDDESAIDLADLIDAPSHTEDVIGKLTEAFPGAELISADEEDKS